MSRASLSSRSPVRRGETGTGPSREAYSTARMRFESNGTACVGRLYKPDRPSNPPVVVMAPGFAAERRFRLPAVAERLAEAGYAVFAFDYRGFGESDGEPRNLVSPSRQVDDLRAAVAGVRELDDVDGSRLALWGVSLSGGHALKLAAEDARVAAVVARTPFVDGRAVARTHALPELLKGVGVGAVDKLLSLAGRHYTVPVVGDPEEFAVLNQGSARGGYEALVPSDSDWENETPAGVFLSLLRYRPVSVAGDVDCPVLLTAGTKDDVVPVSSVESAADSLPSATLVRMPVGHFDAFEGTTFDEALGHERAFLDAHL